MNFILFLGILLLLGLASTRLMKLLKLPNVTGYLIVGLITALICILTDSLINDNNQLTTELNSLNGIVSNIALGFIALSIGEEFKLTKLKEYGMKIIAITLFESLTAVILVDLVVSGLCLLMGLPIYIALCLGAIAGATAPAATLMVIHQYKAQGPLVDILLPVVAFDDAVGLIAFAISVAISKSIVGGELSFFSIGVLPLLEIVGSLAVGFIIGYILHLFMNAFKSRNNHIIMIIAATLLGVGACISINKIQVLGENLEFSNLLCCMMIGATYVNFAKAEQKEIVDRDFELIDHWTPFLFMLFFVLSGAHLITSAKTILESDIPVTTVLVVFAGYVLTRSCGKYLGAFIGSKVTKREKTINHYLGITLLPQAGVAIGMANQISNMDAFKDSYQSGNIIVTVVLGATLIYELVGPLLTKWALNRAGEIPNEDGTLPYQIRENKDK